MGLPVGEKAFHLASPSTAFSAAWARAVSWPKESAMLISLHTSVINFIVQAHIPGISLWAILCGIAGWSSSNFCEPYPLHFIQVQEKVYSYIVNRWKCCLSCAVLLPSRPAWCTGHFWERYGKVATSLSHRCEMKLSSVWINRLMKACVALRLP